jgi:pyruvoyl-dependent arginine decarboxylase (PvlArgDC)
MQQIEFRLSIFELILLDAVIHNQNIVSTIIGATHD